MASLAARLCLASALSLLSRLVSGLKQIEDLLIERILALAFARLRIHITVQIGNTHHGLQKIVAQLVGELDGVIALTEQNDGLLQIVEHLAELVLLPVVQFVFFLDFVVYVCLDVAEYEHECNTGRGVRNEEDDVEAARVLPVEVRVHQ